MSNKFPSSISNQFVFLDDVLSTIKDFGGGEFHSVKYASIVDGSKLAYGPRKNPTANPNPMIKISKVSIRTKLDYEHTKRFQDYCEAHGTPSDRPEDVTYIIGKAVKHNNKTDNDLLMIIPRYDTFVSEYYELDGTPISNEDVKARLAPKKADSEPPYVMSINARQILALN